MASASGQILRSGLVPFAYASGRLVSATDVHGTTTYTYDRNRRRRAASASSVTTYSWDAADRLSAVAIDSDVDGHAEFTAAHTYDATGQRRSSVVTSGSVTTTTAFTYDGISLLGLASTTGTATTHLTYLRDELDHPRAVVVDAPELASPVTLGLGTTMRGDVVSLTDGSGATLATWSYDPYGRPLSSTVTTTALLPDHALASRIARLQVLRYAGYVYDEASGLYYLSQRYYDPGTCQFISRDPVGADGEESAYQYCGGDPVGATDPSGCATLDEAMASTVWGALSWTAKKYGTKYLSKDSAKLLKHYKKKYGAKGPKKATMADVKSPAPTIADFVGAGATGAEDGAPSARPPAPFAPGIPVLLDPNEPIKAAPPYDWVAEASEKSEAHARNASYNKDGYVNVSYSYGTATCGVMIERGAPYASHAYGGGNIGKGTLPGGFSVTQSDCPVTHGMNIGYSVAGVAFAMGGNLLNEGGGPSAPNELGVWPPFLHDTLDLPAGGGTPGVGFSHVYVF